MQIFTVTITDPAHVAGITAAREAYNAQRAQDDPVVATNDDYVQFVMARAAESYAKQYGVVNA
jgi:hypothetical protein